MKNFTINLALFTGILVVFVLFYHWDSSLNRGHEFGYYGQYNRTGNALASIPGVVFTNTWYHGDITLEEFGFDITMSGTPVDLFFGETDKIRKMSRPAAVTELKARIAAKLAASNIGQ